VVKNNPAFTAKMSGKAKPDFFLYGLWQKDFYLKISGLKTPKHKKSGPAS
jgi:hypothetical protein